MEAPKRGSPGGANPRADVRFSRPALESAWETPAAGATCSATPPALPGARLGAIAKGKQEGEKEQDFFRKVRVAQPQTGGESSATFCEEPLGREGALDSGATRCSVS